jgi:hypothetical protein
MPSYGRVVVNKKVNNVDQNGNDVISNLPPITLDQNDFKLAMDQNEFVSSVAIDSIGVLLSTFMKVKIKIRFKDDFPNLDKTKLRIFTSDFTYMNEREFKVK